MRDVLGIRFVGRLRRMLGALMVVPGPLRAGGADVRDPRQRPHDPGCPRRDRPLDRALERAGPPLWGVNRDHPQGALTRCSRLPGPLEPPASAALDSPRGGADHRLRLRRATGFPLDDLTFGVTHFLPHLNRDSVYRILKAEGLGRLPPASRSRKPNGTFKDDDLGFVHGDVKHRPKLRTQDGQSRQRSLYVAIDRASRFVHLAVRDDETERSAVAFLKEAVQAFPFQVTHGLTDRGSCFTADGFEAACRKLGVTHRKTRPYTPRTNGMVERFNGRIQREGLGITVASHRDLETLLQGFTQAYNARRQRVLKGRSPDMLVREPLSAAPARANRSHDPPFDPCILPKALQVIARAKDVSHPNTCLDARAPWRQRPRGELWARRTDLKVARGACWPGEARPQAVVAPPRRARGRPAPAVVGPCRPG